MIVLELEADKYSEREMERVFVNENVSVLDAFVEEGVLVALVALKIEAESD